MPHLVFIFPKVIELGFYLYIFFFIFKPERDLSHHFSENKSKRTSYEYCVGMDLRRQIVVM
jgi:hypothetical protein